MLDLRVPRLQGSNLQTHMANIRLLRAESVTPIDRYLARSASAPRAYAVQLDLAVALLCREREYAAMYWWTLSPPPVPASGGPFHPHDLTPAGAAWRAWSVGQGQTLDPTQVATVPFDLFGLKADVAVRLAATLRPVMAHRYGWAVVAQLWLDQCRYDEALHAAEEAADLGAVQFGLALAYSSADGERRARQIKARARREGIATGTGWPRGVLGREWADWLQRASVRVRRRVEGEAFTRFLTSDHAFCESERAAALATFDIGRVPPDLHAVEDLARTLGIGDDACRRLFVRRMSAAARRQAAMRIRAVDARIQEWLSSLTEPYEAEAAAYFWLSVVAEELADGR